MSIKIVKSAGFCFGVRRAVDAVYKLRAEHPKAKIVTLGELIHNPTVVAELEGAGIIAAGHEETPSLLASLREGETLIAVIRTHGVTKEVEDALTKAVVR